MGLFWREIVTVFRVLFFLIVLFFLNNADVKKCKSFKSFSCIIIIIIIIKVSSHTFKRPIVGIWEQAVSTNVL